MEKYKIDDYELSTSLFEDFDKHYYRLDTEGNNLKELMDNAKITVLDHNYVELYTDNLYDYSDCIIKYVEKIIKKEVLNA